ncbi:MAG: MBL fold metallo-hydrolase [Pseudomonadota bacterium]
MVDSVEIAPGVFRVRAPNPSAMTFTGTNSYVLSGGIVIDPGPNDDGHLQALAYAAGAAVTAIVLTHTHIDHSAGAPALAAMTGAPIYGFGPHGAGMSEAMLRLAQEDLGGGEGADRLVGVDHLVGDEELVELGGVALRALHTPGHISNHLCLAIEGTGTVFSGDHVMGWATSLISPPDGDMGAFMRSLDKLLARDDRLYLPGHGEPVEDPASRLMELRDHRRMRETQILDALTEAAATKEDLVTRLYTDIDARLHGMAARNVLAHLVDLWERDVVTPDGDFSSTVAFRLS